MNVIELRLGDAPTREELAKLAGGTRNYQQQWASRLLKELDAGQKWFTTYPYPIQVWRLGEQSWISMGGEVVVDYDLKFKRAYGRDVWVTGYANDVMAYIPSLRVLKEGGYEGQSSMLVYGMPAHRWAEDIEDRITQAVDQLVKAQTSKADEK